MKVAAIVEPNTKGQIVIPKRMRKTLGIGLNSPLHLSVRGKGIYIYPIVDVIRNVDHDDAYPKILEKTRGSWAGDEWDAKRTEKRKRELAASKKRKTAW